MAYPEAQQFQRACFGPSRTHTFSQVHSRFTLTACVCESQCFFSLLYFCMYTLVVSFRAHPLSGSKHRLYNWRALLYSSESNPLHSVLRAKNFGLVFRLVLIINEGVGYLLNADIIWF